MYMASTDDARSPTSPTTSPATSSTADSLAAAHARISDLFSQVSEPGADRGAALQTRVRSMAAHASAETQHLIPALESLDAGPAAAHLGDANHEAERLLVTIERRSVTSPDMVDLVNSLLAGHEAHVEYYGREIEHHLVAGGALAGDTDLAEKVEVALADDDSHPHPLLPDHGPLGKVGRAVASVVDATRNKTVDR